MAKRTGVNKSEKMRELARQGLDAQGIMAELDKQGLKYSKPSVYTNLKKVKNGKGPIAKKATSVDKPPAVAVAKAAPSTNGTGFSADDISTLASLADKAGGLSRLGEIVTVLGKIK